jgi:CheY-like chemotaxis protein
MFKLTKIYHCVFVHFETIIASNGKTGLERARFSQPDLILLDVLMPEMDGFETCRHLKSDNAIKDIPLLFMTVLNETSDKLKGFQAGAVDYYQNLFRKKKSWRESQRMSNFENCTKNKFPTYHERIIV